MYESSYVTSIIFCNQDSVISDLFPKRDLVSLNPSQKKLFVTACNKTPDTVVSITWWSKRSALAKVL